MWTYFFRNPRVLMLVVILITGAGVASFEFIPRSEDPQMVNRYSFIITPWPGASAERVESLVTEKLEGELFELQDIRQFRSTSLTAMSIINLEIDPRIEDVDRVWSRVRDRLASVSSEFPEGVGEPYLADREEAGAYSLLAALTWEEDTPPPYGILRRLAEELESRLRFVPGTEYTRLFGAPREEVTVEVENYRLAQLGMSIDELSATIAQNDPKSGAGRISGAESELLIEVAGEFDSLQRLKGIPVRRGPNGEILTLQDMATIKKSARLPLDEVAYIDGKPGIVVAARMAPDRRVDRWAAIMRNELEEFSQTLPASISTDLMFDQSEYVADSLYRLARNLLLGICFVTGVSMLMMGWRSAVLIAITLPLTALMVITGMYALGVTVHQISIMGLVLALGLLIDNAIIVVDAIRSRRDAGMETGAAISQSCRHLLMPLLGSTLTTVFAFTPLLLLPGGVGDFVGQLGVTVILSLGSSFLLALTVVPALTGLFFSKRAPADIQAAKKSWLLAWWTEGFKHPLITGVYLKSLDLVLRRPSLGILIGIVLPLTGFIQFGNLEEQFFPPSERDQFRVQLKFPAQTPLAKTRERALEARQHMLAHSEVERVDLFVGVQVPRFFYNVLSWDRQSPYIANALVEVQSAESIVSVVHDLQEMLDASIPEAQTVCRLLEQGPPVRAPIEVRVEGPSLEVLHDLGTQLRAILAGVPQVIHTQVSLEPSRPKLSIQLDDTRTKLAGLNRVAIAHALDASLSGVTGGYITEATELLPIRVRISGEERGDINRVASLHIMAKGSARDSAPVSLSALGDISFVPDYSAVSHNDGVRSNSVYGYVHAGVLPATVLASFQERLQNSSFVLPEGYALRYAGEKKHRDDAISDLLAPALVLMLAMAGTMVMTFNSFRLAALIALVGALSSGLGLTGLWLFGFPFGFMSVIGTMGLVGVAINDSIVVLAAIRANPLARRGDRSALKDVIRASTRHILSTSLTTIAGFMPLLLAGGLFWPPLAVAIAGGVLGATVLALYFVPAAYLITLPRKNQGPPEDQTTPNSHKTKNTVSAT